MPVRHTHESWTSAKKLNLFAVVACQVIDSADRLRLTVTAFLAGAVVPVAIGLLTVFCFYFAPNTDILQYFTHHYGVVPVGNYPRISSTFISASMLMNYLTVALALLMLVRQKYVLSSTVFFAAAAALIVCSGFTISIGLGAVFLIISIYLYISTNGRTSLIRAVYAVFGIVGATTFLLIAPFTLQTNSKASPSVTIPFVQIELFASPRALIWEEASAKFLDDPLTGSGPGTPAANLLFRNSDGSTSILTDAHNTFLSVAVQAGILGLLALVLLCYHVLRAPFRPPWSHDLKYRISAWLGIAFFSAFIYQGLTGSFEDARHLWLLIGLIAAATSIERGETSDCRTIARPVCL